MKEDEDLKLDGDKMLGAVLAGFSALAVIWMLVRLARQLWPMP